MDYTLLTQQLTLHVILDTFGLEATQEPARHQENGVKKHQYA